MRKRIVVAMSGGVDSATAAALLKEKGYDVIGITMQLWDYGDVQGGCCSIDDVKDARRVAEQIGIKHYVVNYMDKFNKHIVSDFIEKYMNGRTPSPCVLCNEHMKFDFLLKRALELGSDFLATGHYARIVYDDIYNQYHLCKAVDSNKDQSYFLFTLKQNELSKILFPLGDKTKEEVREHADKLGLRVARKPDSQGVCFITGSTYKDFLKSHMDSSYKDGEIVDTDGNVIGHHEGIYSYTVGQRRGLGIAKGEPLYVVNIDTINNRVVVGPENKIYSRTLSVNNLSWTNTVDFEEMDVRAKIRYRHNENKAKVKITDYHEAIVDFHEPQRAVTPGQAIVFYDDEKVVGGGWINKVLH